MSEVVYSGPFVMADGQKWYTMQDERGVRQVRFDERTQLWQVRLSEVTPIYLYGELPAGDTSTCYDEGLGMTQAEIDEVYKVCAECGELMSVEEPEPCPACRDELVGLWDRLEEDYGDIGQYRMAL